MVFIGCYSDRKSRRMGRLENNVIHHIEKYQNKNFLLKKWGLCRRKWIFVSWKNPLNETLKQLISMLPIS
jgi:hypothetical protein